MIGTWDILAFIFLLSFVRRSNENAPKKDVFDQSFFDTLQIYNNVGIMVYRSKETADYFGRH